MTSSSIVGPQSGCSSSDGTADPGTEYIAVTNAVGGIHESICAEDWVPVLEQLGLQAAGLRREYFLSEMPVPGTLEVWVVDDAYTYDGVDRELLSDGSSVLDHCDTAGCFIFDYVQERNSILMEEYVPSPLAEVNIRYELPVALSPSRAKTTCSPVRSTKAIENVAAFCGKPFRCPEPASAVRGSLAEQRAPSRRNGLVLRTERPEGPWRRARHRPGPPAARHLR